MEKSADFLSDFPGLPPIPNLPARNHRISQEGLLKRSWSVVENDFFRIYADEPLSLEVEFRQQVQAPRVHLYSNILDPAGNWEEYPFAMVREGVFSISLRPQRSGIFQFKIKYSLDNGATWFWDRTGFTKVIVDPPAAREIRLYTLIPTVSGHMGEWKKHVSRVKELGFNMVHLLPVTRMGASRSPYAASDLFDVDPSYLDPDDHRSGIEQFADFVRHCKSIGMRLCLDLVFNHIGIDSVMVRQVPDWIVPDRNEPDGLLRAGCWHMNSWIKWTDLAKIHYDLPEEKMRVQLWNYMRDYGLFWSSFAAATGGMIRLDNLHSGHKAFMSRTLSDIRRTFPELVIQAEFFSDSNTLLKAVSESDLNLLLANPWEYPFAENLRTYISYIHEISGKLRFLTPVTTHDTGSPAQIYGSPDAVVPRYFVTALMSTGQTGFVQGAEHGVMKKVEFIGHNLSLSSETPDKYSGRIAEINALHSRYGLFKERRNIRFVDHGHGAVLVALREDPTSPENRFLLAANLDTTATHFLELDCTPYAKDGLALVLRDLIHQSVHKVADGCFQLKIEPCGVRAFKLEYAQVQPSIP